MDCSLPASEVTEMETTGTAVEDNRPKRKPSKARKPRSTDYKVLRMEPVDSEAAEPSECEFTERKKRGKRVKRKVSNQTDVETMDAGETAAKKPHFPKLTGQQEMAGKSEIRKIRIPLNRMKALKENWLEIYNPIVKHLFLQVRFNVKVRRVEIKTCKETKDVASLQKAEDFVKAFAAGFEVQARTKLATSYLLPVLVADKSVSKVDTQPEDLGDALALLRLDDLYMETFMVQDVKTLRGDHLARALGRIAGKNGKTKYTIENVTKTRIVMAESKISILGTFHNIAAARRAISNLILGSPPSKVYGTMRSIAAKVHDRI